MNVSVFLSYPKPFLQEQEKFLHKIQSYFESRGISPRTLGVTDYDLQAPLRAIRSLMLECNGLVTIGFRRTLITEGIAKPNANISNSSPSTITHTWLSTPWPHIETAMAYQLGLPILIFREKGVIEDGILEKGVVGIYMPEFDVDDNKYFNSLQWKEIINKWEGYVRAVVEKKGNPPQLY